VKAAEVARLAKRGSSDPTWWVREVLGDSPWEIQSRILEAVRDHREVNVRSCHSAGKSWVASRAALWFLFNHPESLVITTAPTARQVRGILWKEIRTAHRKSCVPLGGDMAMTALRLGPGWQALGFTAAEHDPDRFQGFHSRSTMVIVDEACGISEEIDTAVDSILSGEHVRLLRIGNPTNIATPFGSAFRHQRGKRFAISAFDTPNFTDLGLTLDQLREGDLTRWSDGNHKLPNPTLIAPKWVEDKFRQWGESSPLFQSRILAEFPTGGESLLFDLSALERAVQRDPEEGGYVSFGVDVARHGTDETVICMRQGNTARILAAWNGVDTMATVGRIIALADKHSPHRIFVDEIGLGAGVLDRLAELGKPAEGINVARAARESERFENLRAELFWNLRERFEENEITLAEDPTLVEQLSGIRYEFSSRGRIKLESKAGMSGSPDRADALALAFAPVSAHLFEPIQIPTAGVRSSPWAV
jgi:phage terminase large subunit